MLGARRCGKLLGSPDVKDLREMQVLRSWHCLRGVREDRPQTVARLCGLAWYLRIKGIIGNWQNTSKIDK